LVLNTIVRPSHTCQSVCRATVAHLPKCAPCDRRTPTTVHSVRPSHAYHCALRATVARPPLCTPCDRRTPSISHDLKGVKLKNLPCTAHPRASLCASSCVRLREEKITCFNILCCCFRVQCKYSKHYCTRLFKGKRP
jgi:hypothetical protein